MTGAFRSWTCVGFMMREVTKMFVLRALTSLVLWRSWMKLEKTSPPERGNQRPTERRTDTPTFYHVSAEPVIIENWKPVIIENCAIHCVCRESLICLLSICRWPLSCEAVRSKHQSTHWLHQCKFCACKSSLTVSLALPLLLCICLHVRLCDRVSAFRAEDQRETSSAPRVLCTTPWPTSGGWCGSRTSA